MSDEDLKAINTRLEELENAVLNLQSSTFDSRLAELADVVLNLQSNTLDSREIQNQFNSQTASLESKVDIATKKVDTATEDIQKIKSMQGEIFAVMALFFGIFTFISIDINVVKSLLSFFDFDPQHQHPYAVALYIGTVVALIFSQLLFFKYIKHYLLNPFLDRLSGTK